ncbi:hypothetical protein [Fluviicola taffensis]|uniref:Carboxypeptidase regulatory-like domain-containing protein n=1 Tax=Fluviicola taffensis (strain DSM 16823 / NCIMB 13979 / RW262) TaxID=755732 RepID=F2II96_FLUTR|nr:hypothetical protein [Fluviicola taffensis]AEA43805.1 hypothetical protein Fluta_1818 [Fluviicola taffensis DSM 16823]
MRFIITLIVIFSLVISCTKFGKTDTAKGRVLNPVTGEGISGVELKLLKSTAGLPGGNKAVKTATTDGDGFYEISKAGLKGYSLSCNLPADYYPVGWFVDGELKNTNTGNVGLKKGKTLHADFYAVPYGNIIIYIKNNSCFDSNDNVKLYFNGGPYDSRTFNPGLMTSLDGCIDIPGSPVKSSMGYKYFHWEVTKNGITTTYYDTIFVGENQTATLNVFY